MWQAFLARERKSLQRPLKPLYQTGKLRLLSKDHGQPGRRQEASQRSFRGQLRGAGGGGGGRRDGGDQTSFPQRPALPAGVSEPVPAPQLGHRWPAPSARLTGAPVYAPRPPLGASELAPSSFRNSRRPLRRPRPRVCSPARCQEPQVCVPGPGTPRCPPRPGPRWPPPPPHLLRLGVARGREAQAPRPQVRRVTGRAGPSSRGRGHCRSRGRPRGSAPMPDWPQHAPRPLPCWWAPSGGA